MTTPTNLASHSRGWRQALPNAQLKTELVHGTCQLDVLQSDLESRGDVQFIHEAELSFFGEELKIGALVRQYTNMRVNLVQPDKPREAQKLGMASAQQARAAGLTIRLTGDETTELFVHFATVADMEPPILVQGSQ